MKKFVFGLLFCVLILAGCISAPNNNGNKPVPPPGAGNIFDKGKRATDAGASGVKATGEAIDAAEPVIVGLENITGKTLSEGTINKGEKIARKVKTITDRVQGVVAIAASVPGPQQPFLGGIYGLVGALGTLAGGIAGFFQRRRARRAELARDAVITGADSLPGAGKLITAAARAAGVADAVEKAYKAVKLG